MKKNNAFSFSEDNRFKEELLKKMKAVHSPELSDDELFGVVGGQGGERGCPQFCCPDWENENGEPYCGCLNCTNPFCRDL